MLIVMVVTFMVTYRSCCSALLRMNMFSVIEIRGPTKHFSESLMMQLPPIV